MSNFKEASKQALRFATTKGNLSTEQLWNLSLSDLDALATSLDEALEASGKRSYLKKTTAKNKTLQLQRDIVVDILETKVEEKEAAENALEKKRNNEKILELIARKKDTELEGKSIEELEAMLK